MASLDRGKIVALQSRIYTKAKIDPDLLKWSVDKPINQSINQSINQPVC